MVALRAFIFRIMRLVATTRCILFMILRVLSDPINANDRGLVHFRTHDRAFELSFHGFRIHTVMPYGLGSLSCRR